MAWRLAKSLETLRSQVDELYPNRSKVSDGTIGDAAHASSASDHNPNAAGVVCALDLTHHAGYFDAHALANSLIINRHPNLKYVISNRRIAGAFSNWRWLAYAGINPHDKHIHISVGVGADGSSAQPYDDITKWNIGGSMPTQKEVLSQFRSFGVPDPTQAQLDFYSARDWGKLNGDLLQFNFDRRTELAKALEIYQANAGEVTKWLAVKALLKQIIPFLS